MTPMPSTFPPALHIVRLSDLGAAQGQYTTRPQQTYPVAAPFHQERLPAMTYESGNTGPPNAYINLPQQIYPQPPPVFQGPLPPLATQPQFGHLSPFQRTRLPMPARSLITNVQPLHCFFDLPAHMRTNRRALLVSRDNPTDPQLPQLPPQARATRWTAEQNDYLFDLCEMAVLILNRRLAVRDFPAIAEALHRRFRGTARYLERGYNTIHSHFCKNNPAYDGLLVRLGLTQHFPRT